MIAGSKSEFYVYIFLRPDKPGYFNYGNLIFNEEPFYVGKGYKDRIEKSKTDEYNRHKLNIFNKIHKLNLTVKSIKLKEKLTESEAYILEIELIKKIGRSDLGEGPLVNLTDGGDGSTGAIHEFRYKPVLQYELNGFLINKYESIKEAEAKTGIKNIGYVCNKQRFCAGNFIWRWHTNNEVKQKIDIDYLKKRIHNGSLPRAVVQYDINNNFITRFASIKEAMEKTGCHKTKIVAVCKKQRKHTLNFIWKYENEI